MNDFTKEELTMLKNGIQYLSDRTSLSEGYLEAHNALEARIQSMIDNYDCEHFGVIQLDDDFMPVSPETCLHCGNIL